MARPTTITDERILNAARAVFLEEGFSASTAVIARRAGVSEGTLFKRFETKEALFLEAMQVPPMPAWLKEMETMAGKGDLQENLRALIRNAVRFLLEVVPQMTMQMGSRVGPPPMHPTAPEPPPVRDMRVFVAFFRQEMELNRVRQGSPEAMARLLFGALMSYGFETMLTGNQPSETDIEQFATLLTETLWLGIAPEPSSIPE